MRAWDEFKATAQNYRNEIRNAQMEDVICTECMI